MEVIARFVNSHINTNYQSQAIDPKNFQPYNQLINTSINLILPKPT